MFGHLKRGQPEAKQSAAGVRYGREGCCGLDYFNRGNKQQEVLFNKLGRSCMPGKLHARDLWRQTDLPDTNGSVTVLVPAHGVVLLKLTTVKHESRG